jgi:hypothetical protein
MKLEQQKLEHQSTGTNPKQREDWIDGNDAEDIVHVNAKTKAQLLEQLRSRHREPGSLLAACDNRNRNPPRICRARRKFALGQTLSYVSHSEQACVLRAVIRQKLCPPGRINGRTEPLWQAPEAIPQFPPIPCRRQ